MRRLAAEDSDIDIIGMDVIWTAEFAEAEWIKEITGADRTKAERGVLPGPLETAKYKGRLWTVPFTSNTQLLWYRKDLVKQVPKTWDEMIDQAERLNTTIQVQAARYEGLVVWFNSLVASAGGEIVDDAGDPVLGAPAVQAAEVMKRLASSSAAPPAMTNNKEDQARLGFESGASAFQVNYSFVYASAKTGAETNPGDQEDLRQHGLGAVAGRRSGQAEPRHARRNQPGGRLVLQEPRPRQAGGLVHRAARQPGRSLRKRAGSRRATRRSTTTSGSRRRFPSPSCWASRSPPASRGR